ncbi:MAG: hypothetical protein JXM71_00285, partial [Spirochaetales bacterium]|nr:hypothetical protein [Spirochaetales bacterium]
MSEEIDPEIAALLGGDIEEYTPSSSSTRRTTGPSYEALFGEMGVGGVVDAKGEFDVDLSKQAYNPIERFESEPPTTFFEDPQYYQKALAGEGELSQRFHELLKKYLQSTDPKDRGMYRQQVVTAYWNMVERMIPRVVSGTPVIPKQLLVRFGLALPTMISPEQRAQFGKVIHSKVPAEPVYYLDEWLRSVAMGQINPSSTDEVNAARGDERTRFNTLLQKAMGKRDTAEAVLKAKAEERKALEGSIRERVDIIAEHCGLPGFYQIPAPYTESQKKTIADLAEMIRRLVAADKELVSSVETYEDSSKDVQSIKDKMGALGEDSTANLKALGQEFETVRQMIKMCVGRQGNHFPLVTKEYFHLNFREMGTRENVIDALTWLESIDCQAYCRPYKG